MNKLKLSLTQAIFVGMAVGLAVGYISPDVAVSLKPISTIFLRLIKSIIVPLIFSTLVVGVAGHGNMKQVGRMGIRSLIYFEVVTTIALVIGLVMVNLTHPGVGVNLAGAGTAADIVAKKQTLSDVIAHIFPQSFFQAAAEGEVLQVVVFALIFSFALALLPLEKRQILVSLCETISETMFKFTGIVMKFAPFGVGAAIAVTVGQHGFSVLYNLGILVITFYVALAIFVIFVLGGILAIAKINPIRFYKAIKEPALIAFSTTSSEAALPKALLAMEQFGVPRRIVAFVLPMGYSFNLDGSTLYLSLAAIFVAQAAGMALSIEQQLLIGLTIMMTSKGVAGVPRASLVILAGTLTAFGLPLEGVAVLLGADAILDMGRTAVNVVGNCLASAVIAKWEGELGPGIDPAPVHQV